MSHSAATAQSPRVQGPEAPGRAPGQPGASPWWRVSWSVPAAMRAVRATIVIPRLFALTFKVIGDAQMTLFAVFGGFATLVVTSFGGTRRDKADRACRAGRGGQPWPSSSAPWPAARPGWPRSSPLPVAFAIYSAVRPDRTPPPGVTGCLFAYVLPIASAGSASVLPSRLEGWWLASAASTAAVLLLSPRSPGDRLRAPGGASWPA